MVDPQGAGRTMRPAGDDSILNDLDPQTILIDFAEILRRSLLDFKSELDRLMHHDASFPGGADPFPTDLFRTMAALCDDAIDQARSYTVGPDERDRSGR